MPGGLGSPLVEESPRVVILSRLFLVDGARDFAQMGRRLTILAGLAALLMGGWASARDPGDAGDGPLFPAPTRGRSGYIDRGGRMVIPPQWDDAEPFAEGLAAVGNRHVEAEGGVSRTISREGWIDRTGRVVIGLRWDDAGPFAGGRARVKEGERYGYV